MLSNMGQVGLNVNSQSLAGKIRASKMINGDLCYFGIATPSFALMYRLISLRCEIVGCKACHNIDKHAIRMLSQICSVVIVPPSWLSIRQIAIIRGLLGTPVDEIFYQLQSYAELRGGA